VVSGFVMLMLAAAAFVMKGQIPALESTSVNRYAIGIEIGKDLVKVARKSMWYPLGFLLCDRHLPSRHMSYRRTSVLGGAVLVLHLRGG